MNCKQFSNYIGDYVNHTLDDSIARDAEAHIGACAKCASLARELESTSLMVRSLDRAGTPLGFEERLKARIAIQRTQSPSRAGVREWLRALGQALFGMPGHRLVLRPALAGLIVCVLIVGSVFLLGQHQLSNTQAMDWGYIEACQQQHASFAASNPLADESAVMLRERARDLGNDL